MVLASGVGSWPGEDDAAYAEALRVVLGDLGADPGGLPYLPEVPGRGPQADMTGRSLAVMAELGADLQPAGWRLTDAPGIDHRRARSLLAQDLDGLEEHTQDYAGPFKVQVAGPWTMAATVEKPRGDRVLSDHGARRELAQALAEGLTHHLADLRRRLPGVGDLVVQVDEPALTAVLAGAVPTASGFSRHRRVDLPEASEALGWVLEAIRDAGGVPLVHSCAPDVPVDLLRGAGADGVSVDLALVGSAAYEELAAAVEAGAWVLLGVVPGIEPTPSPTAAAAVEQVLRWLEMMGLEPTDRLGITPTCGLAGATPVWARQATDLVRSAATSLR